MFFEGSTRLDICNIYGWARVTCPGIITLAWMPGAPTFETWGNDTNSNNEQMQLGY